MPEFSVIDQSKQQKGEMTDLRARFISKLASLILAKPGELN